LKLSGTLEAADSNTELAKYTSDIQSEVEVTLGRGHRNKNVNEKSISSESSSADESDNYTPPPQLPSPKEPHTLPKMVLAPGSGVFDSTNSQMLQNITGK
jgi:hypothetical protein